MRGPGATGCAACAFCSADRRTRADPIATCAITDAKTVQCWGAGEESPHDLPGLADVERIACSELDTVCARTEGSQLFCWGSLFGTGKRETVAEPTLVAEHVSDVKLAPYGACYLRDDGAVLCWGTNYAGQLGDGTLKDRPAPAPLEGLADVRSFSVEGMGGCAVTGDGTVSCWGSSPCAIAPGGSSKPRVVSGIPPARWVSSRNPLFVVDGNHQLVGYHCTSTEHGAEAREERREADVARVFDSVDRICVSKTDGSVWCLGQNAGPFIEMPHLRNAKEVALTRGRGCAGFADRLACFGENDGKSADITGRWRAIRDPAPIIGDWPLSSTPRVAAAPTPPHPDYRCPVTSTAKPSPGKDLVSRVSLSQRSACLDGTTVGLVVAPIGLGPINAGLSSSTVWGYAHDALPTFPQPACTSFPVVCASAKAYEFVAGGDGSRQVFIAGAGDVTGQDHSLQRGDGSPFLRYASRLSPATAPSSKLTKLAHIVRIRVNEGYGSPPDSSFVGSDIEVLDGTPGYPPDPTALLESFLLPLANENDAIGKKWRAAVVNATTQRMKQESKFASDPSHEKWIAGSSATWDEASKQLRVSFFGAHRELRSHQVPNPDPMAGRVGCHAPPGADCAPRLTPLTIEASVHHDAIVGYRAVFDKTGARIVYEELPMETN